MIWIRNTTPSPRGNRPLGMGIPPEVSATLVPIILSLMMAAGVAGVAWLKKLEAKWEAERRELLDVMQETRASSQENKEMLKESAQVAKNVASKLEKHTNGMQQKLQAIAIKSTKVAGKYKGMIESRLDLIPEKDELDELETELQGIIDDRNTR